MEVCGQWQNVLDVQRLLVREQKVPHGALEDNGRRSVVLWVRKVDGLGMRSGRR